VRDCSWKSKWAFSRTEDLRRNWKHWPPQSQDLIWVFLLVDYIKQEVFEN